MQSEDNPLGGWRHAIGLGRAGARAGPTYDIAHDELQLNPLSATGYVGVINVKGKYQARIQVPGDGRGGTTKRRQHSLPGLFDTALEAAIYRAAVVKGIAGGLRNAEGKLEAPPRLNKVHKKRTPKQAATPQPRQQPMQQGLMESMPTAMAVPMPMPMAHLPCAVASPLPMQALCYVPPRF